MIAVYILAVILVLYLVFIIGPSIVLYKVIFAPKSAEPLKGRDISKTYFAPFEKMMRESAARVENDYESIRVKTKSYDGFELCADYIDSGSDKTVAFFHGYGASPIVNCSIHTEYFIQRGYNVLLVFQRAHGVSGGDHCTLGILERHDVLSWVDYLDKTPVKNIVLYGISMGASTIAYASENIKSEKVSALVLDCGYTSPYLQIYRDSQRRHLPGKLILPLINALFRLKFKENLKKNTADSLKNNKIPTLFLHGKIDATVPYNDSRINYDACVCEKKLLLPEGLHHTLSFSTGSDGLRQEVFDFIESHFN